MAVLEEGIRFWSLRYLARWLRVVERTVAEDARKTCRVRPGLEVDWESRRLVCWPVRFSCLRMIWSDCQ